MFTHKIIKCEDCVTSKWAGGETRQIYIYPEDSSYAERTFDYRISSATVDLEESDFTSLPGYNRYIMTLNGNINLKHENHHEIDLSPFVTDYFSGSWKTKCHGKCIDFNLMLKENYKGAITPIKNLCTLNLDLQKQIGIYSLFDNVNIYKLENGEEILFASLSKGDMLLFECTNEKSTFLILVNEEIAQGEIIAINIEAYKDV